MTTKMDKNPQTYLNSQPVRGLWRQWPPVVLLGTAVVLTAFAFWSQTVSIPNNRFKHLPIYGTFAPHVSPLALWLIPAGLLLATVGWVVTSVRRIPSWLALTAIVTAGWLTSIAVNLLRGDKEELYAGVSTNPAAPYYTRDLHFVEQYGLRGFIENYPVLASHLGAYNGRTHPPGVQALLWTLWKATGGDHPFHFATALALISLLTGVGAWAMARSYGGERAGRIAAVLAVAAPGPLMLAYTNLDVVFAAFFSVSAALFVIGVRRRSLLVTAAGGAVAGFATFLTYGTSFLVMAAVIAVAVEARSLRQTVRLLAAAAAGGIAMLLLLRLALGFDLWACYQAIKHSSGPFYPYWVVGHPGSVLLWAGLPMAALGVAGLIVRVPGARRPVLPMVLTAEMLVWGLLPPVVTDLRQGEVERTWAFLYPMLAVAAGLVIARWTDRAPVRDTGPVSRGADFSGGDLGGPDFGGPNFGGPDSSGFDSGGPGSSDSDDGDLSRRPGGHRWAGSIIFGLIILSVAQTGLLQALWDNLL